jgi:type II secretion system protein L
MKTLGISITRGHLTALLREQTLLSSRNLFSCATPCKEPYGGPEDAARLAEEVRKATGGTSLPLAVLSLPPSWTYLRPVTLPVEDLGRAKKIHVAELEGSLPIDDEEILSDLLPSPPGSPGRFLAIAARRDLVEKAVATFAGAGFVVDRVVTDHVSILSAALSAEERPAGIFLSTLSEIVVLRMEDGAIRWARQLPASMASDTEALKKEWREMLQADATAANGLPVTVMGEVPAALSADLADADRFPSPPGLDGDGSLLAYGAALAPSYSSELGGFSLRTSAAAESERDREKGRIRYASIAAGVAILSLFASLEAARWAEAKKVASVRAQIRKEFSEAVPGVKIVGQETTQVRQKIQSVRRQQKELGTDLPPLSTLLMKVSEALPAKENIVVREVSFDAGRLRLIGEAGGAPLVETYRAALSAALGPGVGVTVQESQGSAKAGTVRYTIQIEKKDAGRAS